MTQMNNIFRVFQGDSQESYSLDNTVDYSFQDLFRGKFICVSTEEVDYFVAIGENEPNQEYINHYVIHHSEIKSFLDVMVPETVISDVEAAGHIAIHLKHNLVLFYGESDIFRKGFDRKQILPVARYLVEKTNGKIETAFVASRYDSLQRNMGRVIPPEEGVFRCAWRELGGENYNASGRGLDLFLEVLSNVEALDSMFIDLKENKTSSRNPIKPSSGLL